MLDILKSYIADYGLLSFLSELASFAAALALWSVLLAVVVAIYSVLA